MTVFAESVVEIDGKYYDLMNDWNFTWYDANNNWHSTPYYSYVAYVTSSTGSGGDYSGDIQINETVNYNGTDYRVVGVRYNAFSNCSSLTSVELPSSVVIIESQAFDNSKNLTSISMPGVISISNNAFYRCSLTSLQLPKSLVIIEDGAFGENAMSSITIDTENEYFTSVDGVLYDKNVTKIVGFPNKKGGVYTIPSTVTTIKTYTFSSNTTLDELVIPASVTKIENNAFDYDAKINKLTIEDGTTELTIGQGNNIFDGYYDDYNNWNGISTVLTQLREIYWGRNIKLSKNNTLFGGSSSNLNKIVFGENVTTIPKYSFRGCYAINEINLKGGIKQWCDFDFTEENTNPFGSRMSDPGDQGPTVLFNGSPLEGSVELPSGITKIPAHGFKYGCSGITSLMLNADLEEIVDGAFSQLSILETIQLNEPNTYFKVIDNVLYNFGVSKILCFPQLRAGEYAMPSTITTMVARQFYNCSKMTKITLSDNLTLIPEYSFVGCSMLATAIIPSSVVTISNNAFSGCSELATLTLNSGLKYINESAFENCSKLATLTIPATVEAIGNRAFYGCSELATLTLNSGLKYINESAFENCSKLAALSIPATVETIGNRAFYGCSELASLTLAEGLKTIKYNAFDGCKKLTTLTIPASVESIYDYAFDGCTDITNLVIEDATTTLSLGKGTQVIDYGTWTENHRYSLFASCPISEVYIGRNLELRDYDGSGYYCRNEWNGESYVYIYYKSPFTTTLTNVTIGNKVNRLPSGLFQECSGILRVDFDGNITEWCNITFEDADATPFGKTMAVGASPILYLNGQPLHSQVNVPSGATKIGAYAFYGQNGVSNVTLPATIQTIEPYAFSGANDVYLNATNIVTLENINSFSGYVYVPDEVIKTYKAADVWSGMADRIYPLGFLEVEVNLIAMESSPALLPALNALEKVNDEYRITALTNLKIKGTMNGWDILMIRNKMPNLRRLDLSEATILDNDGGYEYYQGCHTTANTISEKCFYDLDNLRTVVLPQNITSIDRYAFNDCNNLEEVLYMPETCVSIGEYAFSGSGLRSIEIGSGVNNIGNGAFENCSRLNSVVIPTNSVKRIESNAFYSCGNLKNLTIGKGLEYIGSYAFYNCGLRSLVLPTSLKRIDYYAFNNCYSLQNINFAEGLTEIGENAFQNCSNLRNLRLPSTLRTIGNAAFRNCSSLSEVHVPSMLQTIGDEAFKGCGLNSVYAYTVVPVPINQNTFDYTGVDLYAPDNSFYAYYLNTQWSQFQDVKEFEALYTSWYTPRNKDAEINVTTNPIKNQDNENAADGTMEPGSGLVFVGDGEQLVKELILNWEHGANYPALIENNNLSVEELKFILNVYPGRWYFFCFPFDVNLTDVTHDGKWVWRYYDGEARAENGSGGWKNVIDGKLKANVGYIFQSNAAGDLEIPIDMPDFMKNKTTLDNGEEGKEVALETHESANDQDASWNLVGNPNTSYTNLDDLYDENSQLPVCPPLTVWDSDNQTYTAVVPGDDDYEIHPFEAFFVQKSSDTDAIQISDDARETYSQSEKKLAQRAQRRARRAVNVNRLLVNVVLSNGTSTDKTRVVFDDSKDMGYEVGCDASKFMSHNNVPQIYTLDAKNVKYAVNNRPNMSHEVNLGISVPAEGDYRIDIPRMDYRMSLKDLDMGVTHDFSNGAYIFHAKSGAHDNRFVLVPNSEVTSISEAGIQGLDINAENGGIEVNGIGEEPVNIYNANGVRVAALMESGRVQLTNGTYIVSLGRKATKVLVK